MSELRSVQPKAAATHRAAHLVEAATGDGKLGVAALSARARELDASGKREMAANARRFKIVGSPAPALTVKADNGADIDFGNRNGRAMILFLWNFRRAPSAEQIAAMRRIYAEHSPNDDVEIFGISVSTAMESPIVIRIVLLKTKIASRESRLSIRLRAFRSTAR